MQRTPLVDDAFLNRLNRMIFNAFFPIMMFQNLYSTPEGFSLDPKLAGFAVASLLTLQAILLIAVPRLVKENPKRGVIIQAVSGLGVRRGGLHHGHHDDCAGYSDL